VFWMLYSHPPHTHVAGMPSEKRAIHTCCLQDPTRCRFFKWTDEAGGSAGGGGGGAFNNYGDRTYNMGGGGGGGGVAKSSDVCYKCNQPGG
jgi:hypothetical protein